jgi:hypothetical protein
MDYGVYLRDISGHQFGALLRSERDADRRQYRDLSEMPDDLPAAYWHIRAMMAACDACLRETRFFEFVVESGNVWLVQVSPRHRVRVPHVPLRRPLPPEWQRWLDARCGSQVVHTQAGDTVRHEVRSFRPASVQGRAP